MVALYNLRRRQKALLMLQQEQKEGDEDTEQVSKECESLYVMEFYAHKSLLLHQLYSIFSSPNSIIPSTILVSR
jgi:hypothetical protein